jgi:hypothetical protein
MEWPAGDIELLAAYLGKEPAPEERLEFAIASLHADYFNAHRGDQPAAKLTDYLIFRNAWQAAAEQSERYSAVDKSFLRTLMS